METPGGDELVPANYSAVLGVLKDEVLAARFRAQRVVNTELIRLYWRIGRTIARQTRQEEWGSKTVSRLAADLRAEFPTMKGFSLSNVKYMRQFAQSWDDEAEVGQQPVGQLPWGHIITLMQRLDDRDVRDWYAAQAINHGWSRNVLDHHIKTRAHERFGSAPTNFERTLERGDSGLAQQIIKDPYALDFLAIDSDASERELETAMVGQITRTLSELGPGFSFVGRQVHFDIDGDDFFVDLLFFHVEQLRYVVVELKTGKFKPEYAGQLGFYVALVEDRLRRVGHESTVGILFCSDKNEHVVRYALAGSSQPVAIASYDLLPAAEKAALPSESNIARALRGEAARAGS